VLLRIWGSIPKIDPDSICNILAYTLYGDPETYILTTFPDRPTVTTISPDNGNGGNLFTIVTINGTNFKPGTGRTEVVLRKVGQPDIPSGDVTVDSASLWCAIVIPDTAAPGLWDVVVINPDGEPGTLINGFSITPSVESITPSSGARGSVFPFPIILTINGTNFEPGSDTTRVKFTKSGQPDILSGDVTVNSPTSLWCVIQIPESTALGQWNIVVTNPDGHSGILSNGFTVTGPPAPNITSITPATGGQGQIVDILDLYGANFIPGSTTTQVYLSHLIGRIRINATNIVVVSPDQITCHFSIPSDARTGTYDVVVKNPDGQSGTLANGFTIIEPAPAPTVTGITPASGVRGTVVKIRDLAGTNFIPGSTTTQVYLYPLIGRIHIDATYVDVVSPDQITCILTIPSDARTGIWKVGVQNPDGQTATMPGGFLILAAAPSVSSIIPNSAFQGTTSLAITDLHGATSKPEPL
jgi:hypothetical protein